MSNERRALIAGASGLVGQQLLRQLLAAPEFEQVGRPLGVSDAKLREVAVDFGSALSLREAVQGARGTDVFCCLGTTLSKAGSQAAFRAVDHDAPLALARESLEAGAQQLILCTAVGADATSRIFYSRVKGELEQALRGLSFPRGVKIVHPSMLLGHREEKRTAEWLGMGAMRALSPIFAGPLWRYRAIKDEQVARAMVNAALREPPGDRVYEGKPLFRLAGFAP